VIGGLVQAQEGGGTHEHLGEGEPRLFAAGEDRHLLLDGVAGEQEGAEDGAQARVGHVRGGGDDLLQHRVAGGERVELVLRVVMDGHVRPEDALTEDEEIIVSFRQHWKLLAIPFAWFVGALIALLVIYQWIPGGRNADIVLTLAVLGAFGWFVVRPVVDWWVTRYVLTNERLMTRKGLIAQSGVEIPLERITNVNFSQTFWERLLRAGDLLVESAGSTGQSRFTNIPRPDDFAAVLYKAREWRSKNMDGGPRPAAAPDDAIEKLRRLKQLHEEGTLSAAEYEEKRQKLLGDI